MRSGDLHTIGNHNGKQATAHLTETLRHPACSSARARTAHTGKNMVVLVSAQTATVCQKAKLNSHQLD